MKTIKSLFLIGLLAGAISCQSDSVKPGFPPTKAYYSFRVFNPADPRQPRNEVGFDTLTYRAEDGSTRVLTNRTLSYEVDYDTTIYTNLPADRILEGYLSARKAQSVFIEVGLIDKSGAKVKQDYRLVGVQNNNFAPLTAVRVAIWKEVALHDVEGL